MVVKTKEEKGDVILTRFKEFLNTEKVQQFIDDWVEKGKDHGIKKAGVVELLLYLWLLDDDADSVLKKASNVLGKLLGMPNFFSSFVKLKLPSDE